MKVVDLPRQVHLLTQSSDQWLNYTPSVGTDDENKQA